MKSLLRFALALTLIAGLGACATKKDGEYAGMDGDYVLGTPLPDRIDGAGFLGENVQRGQYPPIYFGFDSYSISSAESGKVQSLASAMRKFKNSIIIAGFTDERGTDEYNRGLGERRAQAVRSELIALGIDGGRIQTVSFGKEMPADPGSNEEAWAKNRRAEIGVIR